MVLKSGSRSSPESQNPSSTTPAVPQPVPVYEGATISPVQAEPESYPGVPLSLDDLIVSFPADSGIKPIYVMFNSPMVKRMLEGNTVGGITIRKKLVAQS
ncbi:MULTISPECIES: S-type pyocin domain-containing protein [Pseudomonas aeruginosa group]|uniref:S-type pyocin domain-containing protein n=1 Tax=Pseudomonas aeruginosa group TaxID=136841 RepID=UPI001E2E3EEA|nr:MULTISPECIES: S-type pyocin domain-containing protein [Pseudomonas aeruginosa group]MCW8021389.1 S-type pyocin domain-containing protein [Pseudomonas aeruginosa]